MHMKKNAIVALLLTITGLSTFAQLSSYNYSRKLNPVSKEDYYSISLPAELLANCKSNGNDIRLYNLGTGDTTEIPYIKQSLGDITEETAIPFQLINDVTNLKCCSYVTLKMDSKKVINHITLDVLENNFDKLLSVEGSNDNKEWFTIKRHVRIAGFVNNESNFKNTSIYFPEAEYAYFRINMDDDGSPRITVNAANAFEYKTKKGLYNELTINTKQQTENKKEKTSDVLVHFPFNYVVNRIQFLANAGDFYRNFNIYASQGTYTTPKGTEENWQRVYSGVIVSGEENVFEISPTQTRTLKIEIINYDNQPIILTEVKAYSEKVVLQSKLPQSEGIYLAYGKENENAPIYDLVHFKNKIPEQLQEITCGKEETKAVASMAAAKTGLTNKNYLWIAMAAVIILIGYFALSMVRKERGNN